jgi:hypothetical protein
MNKLIVNGCTLVLTCAACPEQYDVFFEDFQIGYLRLRHGSFRADYPECMGTTVDTQKETVASMMVNVCFF